MSAPEDAPFCECGCGEQVRCNKHGVWSRWRPGHSGRGRPTRTAPVGEQLAAPRLPDRPIELQMSMWPDLAPDYDLHTITP